MQPSSNSTGDRLMTTGEMKLSERMTWKQLQQAIREKDEDFSQLLAQNFLLLNQQAREKKDSISMQTLDVIISGLVDLTKAIEERKASGGPEIEFTNAAYTIFSRLADSYNNPSLLKQAGLHLLTEWRMPEAALRYFQRALSLGGQENTIHPLIEMATISAQHKNPARNGIPPNTGITSPARPKSDVNKLIRQTTKLLLTKAQRPSPQSVVVVGQDQRATEPLPVPVKDRLKEASKELAAGNLSAAQELLLEASRQPVDKDILGGLWSNLGRAWYMAGNHAEMEEAYSQAYALNPKGSDSYFNLALAKSLNQKIAEAETLYQFALKLDAGNSKVWCNLGVLYFQNDRFQEAEEAFRAAVQHKPDYARAWDNLAATLTAQDRPDEAIEACLTAIQYKPGFPEAYFKLSGLYFAKGDSASLAEAASALSYVVNYAPLAASANAMLSMIHSRLEQVDSAKASLQRAVETDPKCVLLPSVWNELESAIRSAPKE